VIDHVTIISVSFRFLSVNFFVTNSFDAPPSPFRIEVFANSHARINRHALPGSSAASFADLIPPDQAMLFANSAETDPKPYLDTFSSQTLTVDRTRPSWPIAIWMSLNQTPDGDRVAHYAASPAASIPLHK